MKKIKDLTIKVTYRVGLSDVEVPDKVYDELAKANDNSSRYLSDGYKKVIYVKNKIINFIV